MAKSDLLKQAIADAKTVKETALANAKIALQEAFHPRIKEMLANKLTTEIEDEDEDVEAGATAAPKMGTPDAEMNGAAGDNGAEMDNTGAEMDDDFNWTDNHLSASVGGNDYDFEIDKTDGEESMPMKKTPMSDEEAANEYNEGEDLDINEILRELEGEADDHMSEDTMYEDENEDDMTMATESYKKLRSSGIGKKSKSLYEEDELTDDSLEEIIEAILQEEEEEDANTMNSNMMSEEEKDEMMQEMDAEIQDKEEKLAEAYRTVKRLQSVINEVNLLNAKLLYTNKLFRNFELSDSQKMKVIENFDRAVNTREAKLVFATLAESFKRPNKKRVVKESYASRPITTTAPSVQTTNVLSEGFELANRWKKLAGLL